MPFAITSSLAAVFAVGMAASLAGGAAFAVVFQGGKPSVLAVAAISLGLLGCQQPISFRSAARSSTVRAPPSSSRSPSLGR